MSTVIEYASANEILAAATVLPALAILVVSIRFYTRHVQKSKLQTDDWLTLPALLFVIGMSISLIFGVAQHAIGYPTPEPASKEAAITATIPQVVISDKIEYGFELLAILALGLIKLSVVFFCRRIFVVQSASRTSIITWIYVGALTVWTLVLLIGFAQGCHGNVAAEWGSNEVSEQYCTDGEYWEEGWAMSDFITDVFVICLPLPLVWHLHASLKKKIAISCVFLVGLIAVAASTTRFVIYTKLVFNPTDRNDIDRDLMVSVSLYWTMVETSLSLIAACLPTLRVLITIKSVDSMIRSVRSAVSIHSLRSHHSQGTKRSGDSQGSYSEASYVEKAGIHSISSEAYHTYPRSEDTLRQGSTEHDEIPVIPEIARPDQIYIKRDITQTQHTV